MLNLRHSHFFSVCDGHGHNGQEVSGLLKHRLPFHIEKNLKEGLAKHTLTEFPDSAIVNLALTKAFAESNQEVYKMVSDVRFSGSTCTSMITYGRKVYVANVGDSRTVLIKSNPSGEGKSNLFLF
jgi:serine/threonine protein phosphatase PrpC